MANKQPVFLRNYFLPKYSGFIPSIKSEHPIGQNTTQLAIKQMNKFDDHRFERKTKETFEEYSI